MHPRPNQKFSPEFPMQQGENLDQVSFAWLGLPGSSPLTQQEGRKKEQYIGGVTWLDLLYVQDTNLRHSLQFGIGLHHAGLNDSDRSTVEHLFVAGKIQVRQLSLTVFFLRNSIDSCWPLCNLQQWSGDAACVQDLSCAYLHREIGRTLYMRGLGCPDWLSRVDPMLVLLEPHGTCSSLEGTVPPL